MDLEEAIDLIIETSIELGYIEADAETGNICISSNY